LIDIALTVRALRLLVFTASLLDVQHLKGLVWRWAGKFAYCVLGGLPLPFEWLDW